MCFGLTGPISGERSHLQAPRGAYFEHLSNTSSFQVLDCSNTSSCQSNSHPYPGNPCLTLDVSPWFEPSGAAGETAEGADAKTQELEHLELGGNGETEDMDAEDDTETL